MAAVAANAYWKRKKAFSSVSVRKKLVVPMKEVEEESVVACWPGRVEEPHAKANPTE